MKVSHKLLFLLINLVHFTFSENICRPDSGINTCMLIQTTFTDNFKFAYPENLDSSSDTYTIIGEELDYICDSQTTACETISFENPYSYKVHLVLKKSKISASIIYLKFTGNVELIDSILTVSGMSKEKAKSISGYCVSLLSYCYEKENAFIEVKNYDKALLSKFREYYTIRDLKILDDYIGRIAKEEDYLKAGGRIVIDVNKFKLSENSRIEANAEIYKNIDKSHTGRFGENRLQSGTAGFIFLLVDRFFNEGEGQNIQAIGSCLRALSPSLYQTSSSGGIIFAYITDLYTGTSTFANQVIVNQGCISSSAGFLFFKDKWTEQVIIDRSDVKPEPGVLEPGKNVNKFLIDDPMTDIDFIIRKAHCLLVLTSSVPISVKSLSVFDYGLELIVDSSSKKIPIFQRITLENAVLDFRSLFLIIQQNLIMNQSKIFVKKLLLLSPTAILRQSIISYPQNDSDDQRTISSQEILEFRKIEYLEKNSEIVLFLSFIIFDCEDFINIDKNAELNAAFVYLRSSKINIQKEAIIRALTLTYSVEQENNAFCGIAGSNSAQPGYLNIQNQNEICFKNYLDEQSHMFLLNNDFDFVVSSDIFISPNSLISLQTAKSGGGIAILKAEKLTIEGIITTQGSDAVLDEKSSVGASGGGTIVLDSDFIGIEETALLIVAGGAAMKSNGFGGNGKIILNYKENMKNYFGEGKNFNMGYKNLIYPESVNLPNRFLAFYIRNFDKFKGQIFSKVICGPGKYGIPCEYCPNGFYKPFYGNEPCTKCPCEIDFQAYKKSMVYTFKSVQDCFCYGKPFVKEYFEYLTIMFAFISSIVLYNINSFNVEKNRDDEVLVYKIEDVPNAEFKIHCKGNNTAFCQFILPKEKPDFINNWDKFQQEFDTLSKWSWFEKIVASFLFLIAFSPFYLIVKNHYRMDRIQKLKDFLRRFIFEFKNGDRRVKAIVSNNYSDFQIVFLSGSKNLKIHKFLIEFPFVIQIQGSGSFENEYKIDFSDPNTQMVIKHLKRQIFKNDIKSLRIPDILIKLTEKYESQSTNMTIDYIFAYLNLLFATIMVEVPMFKLKERFLRLIEFIANANNFIRDFGFKINIFFDFNFNEEAIKIDAHKIFMHDDRVFKKLLILFENPFFFDLKIKVVISTIERKIPVSNFFTRYQIETTEKMHLKSGIYSSLKCELKVLQDLHVQIKRNAYMRMIFIYLTGFELHFSRVFWKLHSYHHCKVFAKQTKVLLFLMYVFLIFVNKFKSDAVVKDSKFMTINYFMFPFIYQVHIVVFFLYLVLKKKKILRMMIYCSLMNLIKSIVCVIYLARYYQMDNKNKMYYCVVEAFLCFTICYLSCFTISFEHFAKYLKRISDIN